MIRPGTGILLVDDSHDDVTAIERVVKAGGWACRLHHCPTGDEALDFLHRRGRYANAPTAFRPGVILLDLNLPGSDGRDVLQQIKGDPALKAIPVVVLTTSRDERDVRCCYQAGANSYIQKPVGLEEMYGAVRAILEYWLRTALLPSG